MRALVLSLTVLLAAPPALGQTVTPEAKAQAKRHFERGRTLQKQQDYAAALAEYRAAYELVPTPDLLYNIALVLRLSGDKPAALDHYRRYLERDPNGRGSEEARSWIAKLEAELAQPAPTSRPAEAARPQPDPGAKVVDVAPQPSREDSPTRGRPWRWAGATMVASGLLLGGAGVFFGVRADNLETEAEEQAREAETNGWTAEIDRQVRATVADAESAETTMIVLFVAGGVAAVSGTALWVYGSAQDDEGRSVSVRPAVGPRGALVIAEGRF